MNSARTFAAGLIASGCLLGAALAQNENGGPAAAPFEEEQLIIPLVPLSPGGQAPVKQRSPNAKQIENDPEQIAAGQQLYSAMNCVGCHANGGGGMGPPLMDDTWIYGSALEQIFSSIREGRPNGMPSFRGRLPDEQIWQIAAFVKSLGTRQNAEADGPGQ